MLIGSAMFGATFSFVTRVYAIFGTVKDDSLALNN